MPFETRWKRTKPVRPMSEKRQKEMKEYMKLRRKFLKENPICQCECDRKSVDVHHTRGRAGKMLNLTQFWLAVCRQHHDWVHLNPDQARRLGYTAPVGKWLKED